MITMAQMNLIDRMAGQTKAAQKRREEAVEEMNAKLAELEAEDEAIMALFEEEELTEEITVEEVELGLALIDTYRDQILDITLDEDEWINENVKISDVLGSKYKKRDKENIIDFLVSNLKMSLTKVKRLIRNGLGIKRGSEYQNKQREYIADLKEDFNKGLYDELVDYLKKRKLFDFYRGLLEYVSSKISLTPMGVDEDELVFFVIYGELRQTLKNNGVETGLSTSSIKKKFRVLYELGLIRSLPDECIDSQQLAIAYEYSNKASKELYAVCGKEVELNRRNFYILSDLSPSVQSEAINKIAQNSEINSREKNKNSTALALIYGIDEVQNNMMVQTEINISETKLNNFINAANTLLEKQRYFTEDQLRVQYCKVDHKIKKYDAMLLTGTYLAGVNLRVNAVRKRVNKETRERYSLPSKIKSNSIIYVLAD